jgi:hypothetical protein
LTQDAQGKITWEEATHQKLMKILEEIPELIRGIAEIRVTKKAESILREENRSTVNEKDMVDAFFAETPAGFVGAMKNSMKELGIDYTQYGYEK